MIKLLLILFLGIMGLQAQESEIPLFPEDKKTLLRSHLRYFHKTEKWLYQAEAIHNSKVDNRVNREYQVGAKYRLHNHLKVGAHFSRRYGLRHDNDWRRVGGQWRWEPSNGRGENHLILELSPRYAYRKFLGEFRIRNEFNFFNDQNTLRLRPGLSYFVFHHGKPLITFFSQYEAHIPINYNVDNHGIREGWFWLGGLYHLNDNIKLGTYYAYRDMFWGTSQMFKDVVRGTYIANEQAWEVGLILNITTFD